ncbi:hypothetical protein ACGF0D_43105 [Kitasatospora sp. NPDC048298]|uniref:hypothetical protein n=1 Tax=Kitasatospora sp. NPDC048298 TaxID=3364049 RepID=UPI00372290C6
MVAPATFTGEPAPAARPEHASHRHEGSQARAEVRPDRLGRPGLAAVAAAEKAGGLHLTREQEAEFLARTARVFDLLKANDPSYIAPNPPKRAETAPGAAGHTVRLGKLGKTATPLDGTGGRSRRSDRQETSRQRGAKVAAEKAQRKAENARRDRLDDFREQIQPYTPDEPFRACNRLPVPVAARTRADVPMTYDGKRARWTQLRQCKRVHTCPTCGQGIKAQRRADLEKANGQWADERHGLAMGTFTLRHYSRSSLKDLMKIQRLAWAYAFGRHAGRQWQKIKAKYGITFDVRVWETTYGTSNGWHPHFHVQYFLDQPLTAKQAAALEDVLYARWSAGVAKAGGYLPSRERGVKLLVPKPGEESAFAKYMVKEMTGSDTKTGKKGRRTPHQIAEDWLERIDGLDAEARKAMPAKDRHDLALWREYVAAAHGQRYMRWSPGAKAYFGIDTPDDDEKVKTQEEKDAEAAPVVLTVALAAWFAGVISRRGRSLAMRKAVETGGTSKVQALLVEWNAEEVERWSATEPAKRRRGGPVQLVWGRDVWLPGEEPAPDTPPSNAELSGSDPGADLLAEFRARAKAEADAKPQQLVLC